MYGVKRCVTAITLLLLCCVLDTALAAGKLKAAVVATTVASCATAAPGAAWLTAQWLPCANPVTYIGQPIAAAAVVNDMRCPVAGTAGACVFTWQLGAKVLATDNVWVETAAAPAGIWVSASTLSFAGAVVTPPPPPPPPTGSSTFTLAAGNATINWTPPVTNTDASPLAAGEITGYNVYQSQTLPVPLTAAVNATPVPAGSLAYSVSGLPAGAYYFSVAAVTAKGLGLPLTSAVMVIPTITVTIAPASGNALGLIAIASNQQSVAAPPITSPAAVSGVPNSPTQVTVTFTSTTP